MKRSDGGFGKILVLMIVISIFFLSLVSFISANSATVSIGGVKTVVSGTVYYGSINQPVSGIWVTVECKDNNLKDTRERFKTNSKGQYSATFENKDCKNKDPVTVSVVEDGTWKNKGNVKGKFAGSLDIIINPNSIPITPEFGTIAGAITALSAIGIFFIVRKR